MPERRRRRRRIRNEAQTLSLLFLLAGVVLVTSLATGSLLALGAFAGGTLLAFLHDAFLTHLKRRGPP